MATARLEAVFSANMDSFLAGINKAMSKMDEFKDHAEKVGSGLSFALSVPLGILGKKAVESATEMDSLERGLIAIMGSAGAAKIELTKLNEVAKLPGLGFKEAVKGSISLQAAGYNADLARRALMGFGNALATVGKGKAELDGVNLALTQMATSPKVLQEEINQIRERLPQFTQLMVNAFGTSRSEDIQKLGISGKDFVAKMVTELEKLPKTTGGIQNAFENLSDTSFKAFAKIGKTINDNFNFEQISTSISSFIDKIVEGFTSLSPLTQKVVIGFAALAITIPPIIAAIGIIGPAIASGIAMITALTGPIGIVALAVGVAAAAIIKNWDTVKATLQDNGLWGTLGNIAKAGLGIIVDVVGVFANLIEGDWENLFKGLFNIVKRTINGIVSVIQTGVLLATNAIGGLIKLIGLSSFGEGTIKMGKDLSGFFENTKFKDLPSLTDKFKGLQDAFNNSGSNGGSGKIKSKIEEDEKAIKEFSKTLLEASNTAIEAITVREETEHKMRLLGLSRMKDTTTKKEALIDEEAFYEIQKLKDTLKNVELFEAKKLAILEDAHKKKMDLIQAEEIKTRLTGGKKITTGEGVDKSLVADRAMPVNLKGYDAFLAKLKEQTQAFNEQKKQLLASLNDMNNSISSSLKQGAASAIGGMSELIGGMIAGTRGLSELPNMIEGILAGLAKSIGKTMIEFGVAGLALKKLALAPGAAIAAGVALTILGSALEANVNKQVNTPPKLAKGGLAYGNTIATVGDNPNANINPEVIAPLSELRKYMSAGQNTGSGVSVVRGTDLIISNTRQVNFDNAIRGRG